MLPVHLLDGDEIVIFTVKPSLWFILFRSFRWLLFGGAMIGLAPWLERASSLLEARVIVQIGIVVAGGRVGFAVLQWVSRLYVLTNRRIMRLRGILNVDLFECRLTKIQNTHLRFAWYERITGLGSIFFATAGTGGVEASWINIDHPLELHERIRSAIHRAQQPPQGL